MAIFAVTYDLYTKGQNYTAVHNYLERFEHCKDLLSFWLIETNATTDQVRNDLAQLTDENDVIFVVQLERNWSSVNFGCADWLNDPERNW